MAIESANYVNGNRNARIATGQTRKRPLAKPRMPSANGFTLAAVVMALFVFVGLWGLLSSNGDEAPWLPAGLIASLVLLVAMAAREVVMRRAWVRYTRELEMQMGSESGQVTAAGARPVNLVRIATGRSAATSLRSLQQRLAKADEVGAQRPEAHLEAYRLCEQYLIGTEDAMRAKGATTDVRIALRAGQERVRMLQKHHLLAWARREAQRLTHEAQRRVSVSDKIETAMRAIDIIDDAWHIYPDEPKLRDSSLAVRNFIATVKVAHWVELAERAAFRGRHARAVARYRDALFYLSRAEMSTEVREEAASRINREIEMLRAHLAVNDSNEQATRRAAKNKQ
ncbi:MAG: hypothetical protein ACR2G4_15700 [Pyrinomonadaceae bacterium]